VCVCAVGQKHWLCLRKEIKKLPVRLLCVTWRTVCVSQKVFYEIGN